jgi:hypothetical protein
VILVSAGGGSDGRLSVGGGADATLAAASGVPYCTLSGCACPKGSGGEGTHFTAMKSGLEYVGVSGGPQPGAVTLVGMSLPDFCKKPPRSCVVGNWTAVGFDISVGGNISARGGAGVRLHIDPAGHVTTAFDGMSPVTFSTNATASPVVGNFTYSGTVSGKITLPPPTATSGRWVESSGASIRNLTATLHVTSPFSLNYGPIDLVALANSAGSGAISSQPLQTGRWQCQGTSTLVVYPPAGLPVNGTWTLSRTGPG